MLFFLMLFSLFSGINDFNSFIMDDNNYGSNHIFYKGDLTGYGLDCPLCSGKLSCNYNGRIVNNLYDGKYLIFASSKKYSCGSIVKVISSNIVNEKYGIILDRGVIGNNLDLLVQSEDYANKYIGKSSIIFEVIRKGW